MNESAVAPDWSPVKFEQGRFEIIHNLLNDFEKRISREGPDVDRSEYLGQCQSENERNIMLQEMDYLKALQNQPVKFVGGCLIVRTVAVGGFGVVSLGVDQTGRSVAVKVSHLSWQLARDRDELDEEAMILKELHHPNIAEFIDCGYEDNWYLITEWVNGYNLRDAIKKIRAPLVQWLDIICQVCDALEYGHRLGIIHRDINPRNIMVAGIGKPVAKVLDYGVAKRTDLSRSSSQHVKGTQKYIAPEQYNGKCDERSDIYALGVTMEEVVESQYSHPGRIPRQARAVINKAKARVPSKRYQSAQEFKTAIHGVIEKITSGEIPIVQCTSSLLTLVVVGVALIAVALLFSMVGEGWKFGRHSDTSTNTLVGVLEPSVPDRQGFKAGDPKSPINPLILLNTKPSGAHVTLFRLTSDSPDPGSAIAMGLTPARKNIPPGDYLVVAVWPDGEWMEVLRRIPWSDTFETMPTCPFDSFKREPMGTLIATITKQSFNESDMVECDGFWADTIVSNATGQSFAVTSFGYACQVLEAQGKRLPFVSELNQFRKTNGTNVHTSIDEWTCSLASSGTYVCTLKNGSKATFPDNGFFVIPANLLANRYELSDGQALGNRTVGFRGIRRLVPYGTSSY